MEKFPVVSENGNKYLVKIYESCMFVSHFEVRVYEQYKGWFGRTKYRFLNEGFMYSAPSYDLRKFDFDLVKMAKYEVARMEAEWEAERLLQQKKLEAKQNFNDWNGDCRES